MSFLRSPRKRRGDAPRRASPGAFTDRSVPTLHPFRVSILCPGPTLAAYLADPTPADAVVAVNRAVLAARCDWWVAMDAEALRRIVPPPRPGGEPRLFTSARALRDAGPSPRFAAIDENALAPRPDALPWMQWTVTAAMVLVVTMKRWTKRCADAAVVTLHGCDQSGVADWDGFTPADGRHDDRWRRERDVCARVSAWCAEQGVRIERAGVAAHGGAAA